MSSEAKAKDRRVSPILAIRRKLFAYRELADVGDGLLQGVEGRNDGRGIDLGGRGDGLGNDGFPEDLAEDVANRVGAELFDELVSRALATADDLFVGGVSRAGSNEGDVIHDTISMKRVVSEQFIVDTFRQ